MQNNSLLESALQYAREGYSVIPLRPRDKRPISGFSWLEYNDRIPTEEEIRQWWTTYPQANIGIITGKISGIVAVDIDTGRGGNPKEVFDLAPTGRISQTGSGGYHLLYRYPDGDIIIRNQVGKNGVDIRGDRGYIVAPPSVHRNGRRYRWLYDGQPGEFTRSLTTETGDSPGGPGENNGERWLVEMLSGVGEGSRNDACARLAGYYAGKGIPLDVALALLDSWNNQNKPPLSTTELETTTRSVYRTAYKSSSNSTNTSTNTNTNMNNTVEQTKQEAFKVVDVNTYMTKHGTGSVSWVIDDWLPDETIAFLVSPPGSFKTWMLLDLAVSVAGGTPFLNQFEVNSTGPVLIVQQEDFHGELAERLAVIINNRYNLISQKGDDWQIKMPPNLPIYLHPERRLRFDNPEVMKVFMATVGELRPKLVIIDPLYSTGTMDDYMTKIAELMFPLKRLRDEYRCSFILAHHTKKSAEGNGREGLWGSQFLNAFLETGWQIRKGEQENSVSVLRHFKVKGNLPKIKVDFNIDTEDQYKYEVVVDTSNTESEVNILEYLNDHGPSTAVEIAKGVGVHRTTVTRKIKLLEQDGVVVKEGTKYIVLSQLPQF